MPKDLIAVLNRSKINGHICLRTAMWLHVSVIGAKQLFRTINRSLLYDVGPFASTVIPFPRITFGVFVCEDGPGRFKNRFADKVFGSDQFKSVCLPGYFVVDCAGDQWVNFG